MTDTNHVLRDKEERSLVTFALFAYNQEKYIREAVEGALSQTYEPLEIILSDDCSTDRTFEIMQDMAAGYRGRHKVVLRQSKENRGTLGHILDVAKVSGGSIIVVAAGDDISLPERTGILAEFMRTMPEQVVVISSDDIIFDNFGKGYDADVNIELRREWKSKSSAWFLGGTASYKKSALMSLPEPTQPVLYEDMVLITLFKIMGLESKRIEKRLVYRRWHDNNVGTLRKIQKNDLWAIELRNLELIKNTAIAYDYIDLAVFSMKIDHHPLQNKSRFMKDYARWPEMNLVERTALLFRGIPQGMFRSVAIRLFGKKTFEMVKKFSNALR